MSAPDRDDELRLPGQRFGARQDGAGEWFGFCDDCDLTGPTLAMNAAWDDAQSHWNAAHRAQGESLMPSRVKPVLPDETPDPSRNVQD